MKVNRFKDISTINNTKNVDETKACKGIKGRINIYREFDSKKQVFRLAFSYSNYTFTTSLCHHKLHDKRQTKINTMTTL